MTDLLKLAQSAKDQIATIRICLEARVVESACECCGLVRKEPFEFHNQARMLRATERRILKSIDWIQDQIDQAKGGDE